MSKTARYVLIGLATFVVCLVVLAPATPIRAGLHQIPGFIVGRPNGSLWHGAAPVTYHGTRLGKLRWSFRPQDLLRLRIGYRYALQGPAQDLSGTASVSAANIEAMVKGTIDSALLTELLGRYDIAISGDFAIPEEILLRAPHGGMPAAAGELRWSGGPVTYRLGNTTRRAALPALVAYLESPATGPSATVYAIGDDTPLLLASVQSDGWVSIGVTRHFTELVGQPWSGSQPPHAVVMEVQEKLF